MKKLSLSMLALILVMLCLLISPRRTKAEAVLPTDPPHKCLHYDCTYYEPYNIPGAGSSPGGTMCGFFVEDCDGRTGEVIVVWF